MSTGVEKLKSDDMLAPRVRREMQAAPGPPLISFAYFLARFLEGEYIIIQGKIYKKGVCMNRSLCINRSLRILLPKADRAFHHDPKLGTSFP